VSAALAALILALLTLSGGTRSVLAGQAFSEFAFRPHPGAHLPLAAEFIDEQGSVAPLGRFFAGKPVVLVLDYLRCKTLCGLTLENLAAGLGALPLDAGRDFQIVVISIDPRDKPADVAVVKTKYLGIYHHPAGDVGWHFLAGPQPVVQQVADAVGFPYRYEPALDQYIHPAGFVVGSPDGNISRYVLGVNPQPTELQNALADAAQGKAVGLLTQLLLLCHGDTARLGRYSLAIEGAFVSANLIAMIGGIAVFLAIRRRRHG
jgi:protein SCO1/2